MKQSRSAHQLLRIGAWSTALAFGLGAQAADIYQTANMPINTNWEMSNFWDNAESPSAGNDYFNATGNDTRSPTGNDPVFGGDSLTITNGSRFQMKHGGTATVNLIFEDGSRMTHGGGGGGLDGTITGDGSLTIDMVSGQTRNITINSLIEPNTLSSITVLGESILTVANSANTYTGIWNVASATLKGEGLGQASAFIVGGTSTLDFDAGFTNTSADISISSGGNFILDQDVEVFSASIWGIALTNKTGGYTGAELKADPTFGTAFVGSSDDSTLTVHYTPQVVVGDTIYQIANMSAVATDGWNDTNFWDNGLALIATNDYINNNFNPTSVNEIAWDTRTPASGSDTFGGHSLTMTNGANFAIKNNGPWTVDNLYIWAGSSIRLAGGSSSALGGALNLKGTGSVDLNAGAFGRMCTISSLMYADPTISNIVINIGETSPTNTTQAMTAGFAINSALNDFAGLWIVEAGLLKGNNFGNGSFLVTDMGVLDFDYSYINASADLRVEANPTNAAQNGMLLLDSNVQVGSATLGGVSLPEGSYSGADLKATYGAVIHEDTSDVAVLAVGASIALPVYQTGNQPTGPGWTDPTTWDNNMAPTNLFAYINGNYEARSPNVSNPVFPGLSFTIIDNGYLKFRHAGTATISNLTMYAGTEIVAVTGNQLDGDLTVKGSGSFTFDTQDDGRTLTILSPVTVDSTVTSIVITCSNAYEDSERNATGTTLTDTGNTFTGTWVVDKGYLSGPGLGLGSFHVKETGYLSIGAAYSNETADLTIDVNPTNSATGGQMLLEYDMTVSKATIWGTQLDAGEYTGAYLKSTFGDAFDAASSDTAVLKVTFIPDIPEIGDIEYTTSGSDLVIGFVATNYVSYTILADDNLVLDPAWPFTVTNIVGVNGPVAITNDTSADPNMFYKVEAELD
ncbi:hypothetical protein P4E94_07065 [Pontiellaceae bacterium B12219]|nr:hypothetical protein [Pontiellaceae bacterium B12219]